MGLAAFCTLVLNSLKMETLKPVVEKRTPVVKAQSEDDEEEEEDLIDPRDAIKEKCTEGHGCPSFKEKLEECTNRVESKSRTAETCMEELFDFIHCVDHCVSESLFSHLK